MKNNKFLLGANYPQLSKRLFKILDVKKSLRLDFFDFLDFVKIFLKEVPDDEKVLEQSFNLYDAD